MRMVVADNYLAGGLIWSFGIYVTPAPFDPGMKLQEPVALFNSKRLRLLGGGPHTQADPFLLVKNGTLFIFYELVHPGSVGRIACMRTEDLLHFEDCGVVLAEPHHLSFPYVFEATGETYMVPESKKSGRLSLYRFVAVPKPLTRIRTLIRGEFADPVLTWREGRWYLFATSEAGLELFVSEDLLDGEFKVHPMSPIVTDARYRRCGGATIETGGMLVRVAQDCSLTYGANVSLMEIVTLTPDDYAERLIVSNFFERKDFWNSEGAHHLTVTQFRGETVIAADGKHRDYWVNTLLPARKWGSVNVDRSSHIE